MKTILNGRTLLKKSLAPAISHNLKILTLGVSQLYNSKTDLTSWLDWAWKKISLHSLTYIT